jgi:hypothetical protein
MTSLRVIARMSEEQLAEGRTVSAWLRNAMGELSNPRADVFSKSAMIFETTWDIRSRDRSFGGYAQLSREKNGTVTVLVRDRTTHPLKDDYVFVEPARRDGACTITDMRDHLELRRAADRWIGYLGSMIHVDHSFSIERERDVERAGLLRTKPFGGTSDLAQVSAPSAHDRLRINDLAGAFDEEPHIEEALDSRWADVVEIGSARTSAHRRWSVLTPGATIVIGNPDPMETLRIHRAILSGPA